MCNAQLCIKYKNLCELLRIFKIPYTEISAYLFLSNEMFLKKLTGVEPFTLSECLQLQNYLMSKLSLEYLFKREDEHD